MEQKKVEKPSAGGESGVRKGSRRHRHRHSGSGRGRLSSRILWGGNRRWRFVSLALAVVFAVVGALLMIRDVRSQSRLSVAVGREIDVGTGYRQISYGGKDYRYNNLVTSILYVGVDSDDALLTSQKFTSAPRADTISLVVLDEQKQRMSIIALNRDTMTYIHKFTLNGKDRGRFKDHLGYAFTYGEGGKVSCENLRQAVSDLLFGIPISGYVVSNRASLPFLADALGPVEVTVPNDDLEDLGFVKGEVVTIDSHNIEAYVRTRDTAEDLSNLGRMARQQTYIEGALDQGLWLLANDPLSLWNIVQRAEDNILTDVTRSRYMELAKSAKRTPYAPENYYTPVGEQVVGAEHDEFYPDEAALRAKVLELFYLEK